MADRDGLFGWCDLAAPDVARARAFYTGFFGWTAEQVMPDDVPGEYWMFSNAGDVVAGLGALPAEMIARGTPPIWTSYVIVDDADEIAARVAPNGGTVLVPPFDVMEEGRMAHVADPGGAAFGLWQPRNHPGAARFNVPGAMCWNELQTRDLDAALRFYPAVFAGSWSVEAQDTGTMIYHTIVRDGRPNGGMIAMDENWPEHVPNNWAVYFAVADIDAAAARSKDLGGDIVVPPTPTGVGPFSVLADDQDGTFTVIQLAEPDAG